jgi:release factor glutamine methyltransferase
VEPTLVDEIAVRLAAAGFLAAGADARALLAHAAGDRSRLDELVERRIEGEPLAWIVGTTRFCDLDVRVDPGVYVPRPQTEALAHRAVTRLPATGIALDLCTGSGAIAMTLATHRPDAGVVATDVDARAVTCARTNGVDARCGDLFEPVLLDLQRRVDVVVAVVPYVPTPSLRLLPRDTFAFESPLAYDGGPEGTDVLRRVVAESPRFLRVGGALLLELGGDEADAIRGDLDRAGFLDVLLRYDEEHDVRGIEATFGAPA